MWFYTTHLTNNCSNQFGFCNLFWSGQCFIHRMVFTLVNALVNLHWQKFCLQVSAGSSQSTFNSLCRALWVVCLLFTSVLRWGVLHVSMQELNKCFKRSRKGTAHILMGAIAILIKKKRHSEQHNISSWLSPFWSWCFVLIQNLLSYNVKICAFVNRS